MWGHKVRLGEDDMRYRRDPFSLDWWEACVSQNRSIEAALKLYWSPKQSTKTAGAGPLQFHLKIVASQHWTHCLAPTLEADFSGCFLWQFFGSFNRTILPCVALQVFLICIGCICCIAVWRQMAVRFWRLGNDVELLGPDTGNAR